MRDYRPLTIAAVTRETSEAIALTLEVPPALGAAFDFQPGQNLGVRAIIDGEEQRRSYSICGRTPLGLRIAIKRVPGGRFSEWAHATLRTGDALEVMPPAGRFILHGGDVGPRHLVACAAGVGITPIIAIIRQALASEPATSVTLLFGNRTPESILFGEELDDLKDRHLGRFTLLHVLSRTSESSSPLLEGRISGGKLKALAGVLFEPAAVAHFYLCGPGAMIGELRNALIELGVPRTRIHHEFFAAAQGVGRAAAPRPVAATPDDGARALGAGTGGQSEYTQAIAVLDGVRRSFPVPRGGHLVDAALAAGIRVPYSCKGGMCCTCRAKLVEGKVEMTLNYSLEPWELARGFVLTCQSVPISDRVVVDYDCM